MRTVQTVSFYDRTIKAVFKVMYNTRTQMFI